MTNRYYNTSNTFVEDETTFFTLNAFDTLFVGSSGTLAATGTSSTLISFYGGNSVDVAGTLFAASGYVLRGNDVSGTININIAIGGRVIGDTSISSFYYGPAFINAGFISGPTTLSYTGASTSQMVRLNNSGTMQNAGLVVIIRNGTLTNSGDILSLSSDAVALSGTTSNLLNTGLIQSTSNNAVNFNSTTGSATIVNSGTISSSSRDFADPTIMASPQADRITNTGLIIGDVRLGSGNDVIDSDGGAVRGVVYGEAGHDILRGGAGNDVLEGGLGADQLFGGAGSDTASYARWTDYESPLLVDLFDEAENTGEARGDSFSSIENVIGSALSANELYGDGAVNILDGGAAGDILDGRGGADVLRGGRGGDVYYVDNVADKVIELADSGNDTVYASSSFKFGGQAIETLYLTGTGGLGATGSDDANTIHGNAGNNTINGAGGDDVLRGNNGDDRLIGAAGADTLYGGAGADAFVLLRLTDSGYPVALRDTIKDFSSAQGDRIDLSAIDADVGTVANDAFTFRGTGAFTGVPGQLRFSSGGNVAIVFGDVDGDRLADFAIRVEGTATLTASNFVL